MTSCTTTPITSVPEPDSVSVPGAKLIPGVGVRAGPEDPSLLTKALPSSTSMTSSHTSSHTSSSTSEKASYSCDLATSIPIMLVKIDLFGYVLYVVYYTLILYTYTIVLTILSYRISNYYSHTNTYSHPLYHIYTHTYIGMVGVKALSILSTLCPAPTIQPTIAVQMLGMICFMV